MYNQNNFRMLNRTFWCLALILLLTIAHENYAGVTGRSESDDVDADVSSAQNRNIASIVNVVLPSASRTCRRCICTIAEECPNIPDMTCLSAATLCCCCTPRSFPCRGEDGMLQPNAEFMSPFTDTGTGSDSDRVVE